MADLKISQLTGATTPLAGTEVLPIVQSGTTKKATIANIVGAGTSPGSFTGVTSTAAIGVISQTAAGSAGYIQVSGTANYQIFGGPFIGGTVVEAAAGGVYTKVAGSNITAATASGLEVSIGDFRVGTAGKGLNFTANTPAAGMTSQLLNWYEEGTWTPTPAAASGSITSFTSTGTYTRVGRQVTLLGKITITNAGTGAGYLSISGLPFNIVGTLASGAGREIALTGNACSINYSSATTVDLNDYANLTLVVTGRKYMFNIVYFA